LSFDWFGDVELQSNVGGGPADLNDPSESFSGQFLSYGTSPALVRHTSIEAFQGNVSVSELMTTDVITCSPRDSVSEIAKVMTQRRIRHLPVKDGDQLVGIITIGDVLKHRLDEMQLEANVLRDYAIARR
jgi:CBS domain-containing protein